MITEGFEDKSALFRAEKTAIEKHHQEFWRLPPWLRVRLYNRAYQDVVELRADAAYERWKELQLETQYRNKDEESANGDEL